MLKRINKPRVLTTLQLTSFFFLFCLRFTAIFLAERSHNSTLTNLTVIQLTPTVSVLLIFQVKIVLTVKVRQTNKISLSFNPSLNHQMSEFLRHDLLYANSGASNYVFCTDKITHILIFLSK
jgi:hypothetical protein